MTASPRAAVAFLTRLPVGGGALNTQELSRAALWFPAVGLLVGGVMGGVRALAGTVLDPAPATVLALLAAMLVTGALHEDGLADAADAIGAHVPPAARPDGAGALMRAGAATAAVASAYTVAIALVAGRPAAGAVALGVAALLIVAAIPLLRRALGGATGDTFGALTKVVELACYAALVAMWN